MTAAALPSPSELDALAKVDPELQDVLEVLPRPKLNTSDPEGAVRQMRERWASLPPFPPHPDVRERTESYTTRDGTKLRILVYSPVSAAGPLPLFVWYHGGGGCIGQPEMNANFCRDSCHAQQCVVLAPEYRLAPEHKYPTGILDCQDALKHTAAYASRYGADPGLGFVVGGESAGAVISSLCALQARDEKLNPPLTGVFLAAGSFFNPNSIPEEYKSSYRSRRDPVCLQSPMLSQDAKAILDACLEPDYSSPRYRAALWSSGHRGLPKTYLQACGTDINRDDSIIFNHLLQQAGVQTRLDIYPGTPHCFWFLFSDTTQGKKWQRDTTEGLKWLLSK